MDAIPEVRSLFHYGGYVLSNDEIGFTAWDVSATSGMCGADITDDFIHSLDNIEIGYFFESIDNARKMVKKEIAKRKAARNG